MLVVVAEGGQESEQILIKLRRLVVEDEAHYVTIDTERDLNRTIKVDVHTHTPLYDGQGLPCHRPHHKEVDALISMCTCPQ